MKDYPQIIKDSKDIGELFDVARKITDKGEAKKLFNAYVDFIVEDNKLVKDRKEAESIASSNFGYFAGYFSDEVRDHILKMYGAEHPIFGTSKPTPEEAFNLGKQLGAKHKKP